MSKPFGIMKAYDIERAVVLISKNLIKSYLPETFTTLKGFKGDDFSDVAMWADDIATALRKAADDIQDWAVKAAECELKEVVDRV